MKTTVLVIALLAAMTTAYAQEFKPIKVGMGLGYASPGGEGAKGGVLVYLEPAYRISDEIAIGPRMEAAVVGRVAGSGSTASVDVSANGSYTINGQYYLSNNTFRPFVGLGVGIFSVASTSVNITDASAGAAIEAGTKIGAYPRIGFDLGHLNLSIDYNWIPKTTDTISLTTGGTSDVDVKNSYLGPAEKLAMSISQKPTLMGLNECDLGSTTE